MKQKRKIITMPDEMAEKIRETAFLMKITQTDIVRDAIAEWLKSHVGYQTDDKQ